LPGAIIFITGSKIATTSNESGKFILNGLTFGNYELAVNMLGFDFYKQNLVIQNNDTNIEIELKESNSLLKEITITANKPQINKRYLNWFTRNFIGADENARQCKILNPQVLTFTRPAGQYELEVTANDFLIIENDALGYKIKYLLRKCVYYLKYEICYYDGSSYFEELNGTMEQQKKWEENRKKAYLGSKRHFLWAIINKRSKAEGFSTYEVDYGDINTHKLHPKPIDIDTMLKSTETGFKALVSKPYGKPRPILFTYYNKAKNDAALTWIEQCVDSVLIDKNGSTLPDVMVMNFLIQTLFL
jgi:hypothetical protein